MGGGASSQKDSASAQASQADQYHTTNLPRTKSKQLKSALKSNTKYMSSLQTPRDIGDDSNVAQIQGNSSSYATAGAGDKDSQKNRHSREWHPQVMQMAGTTFVFK
jgi:hypothetical protein